MRHQVGGNKLGRSTDHRMALYRNQVTDLLRYGKITTTQPKAKEVRALAERVITMGKQGTLAARRRALALVYDEKVVKKVFDTLASNYAERHGGYTRMVKVGPRLGDGAHMVLLELV